MSNAFYHVPKATNEPIYSYLPNSPEKLALKRALAEAKSSQRDVPMFIGGKHIFTEDKVTMHPPHERKHVLGTYNRGEKQHVEAAIEAALTAKPAWGAMNWQDRAAIFLKAADLLTTTYRAKMSAATMLCQSKNVYQAEIDCIAEYADFLRFNVGFMTQIYNEQPVSSAGIWNRMEHRPLEGFVSALETQTPHDLNQRQPPLHLPKHEP